MEIAIIPQWVIKYISSDFYKRNDYNILISNILIILLFFLLGNSIISFANQIPHFCILDKITGVECPVCGTTRAFCELSKGNLYDAFYLNRTSILVALFFFIQIPLRILSITKIISTFRVYIISKYLSKILITIILLNWIIKLFINIKN